MKKLFLSFLMIFMAAAGNTPAQKVFSDFKFDISAYVDAYIATDNDDFRDPENEDIFPDNTRRFSVVNNLKDEFALNVAEVSFDLLYQKSVRSKLTMQYGDIPWQAGFSGFREFSIREAYAGVKIIDGLWLDAGFFLTHIGCEGLTPRENWLSSHSLVTYFEPFFHSGARLLYDNDDITIGFHVLNSTWQFIENNQNKTFGFNFGYEEKDWAVTYSGIIGNEEPDSLSAKIMMLHNVCILSKPLDAFEIKGQFDIGTREYSYLDDDDDPKDGTFLGAALQARYSFIDKMSATARIAYFDNAEQAMGYPIKGMGLTIGGEYNPTDNSYIRLETRYLSFDEEYELFINDDKPSASRTELMLNMGVYIN